MKNNLNLILFCILSSNFAFLQPAEAGGRVDSARAAAASSERTTEQRERDQKLIDLVRNGGESAEVQQALKGANVNAKGPYGMTALMLAFHVDLVKLLLKAGADVNAVDNYGSTALTQAACDEYEDIVKLLLEAGADPNANNGKFFEYVSMYPTIKKVYDDYLASKTSQAAKAKSDDEEPPKGGKA